MHPRRLAALAAAVIAILALSASAQDDSGSADAPPADDAAPAASSGADDSTAALKGQALQFAKDALFKLPIVKELIEKAKLSSCGDKCVQTERAGITIYLFPSKSGTHALLVPKGSGLALAGSADLVGKIFGDAKVPAAARRERQLRGPEAPNESPAVCGILVRRYRCKVCKAPCTVGPRELLTQRLYTASAVGWALALFGVMGLAAAVVRKRVSPWAIWGASARRWPTLLRWVKAIRTRRLWRCVRPAPSWWTARQLAERAATTIAALTLPSLEPPPIEVQAFHGAARAN